MDIIQSQDKFPVNPFNDVRMDTGQNSQGVCSERIVFNENDHGQSADFHRSEGIESQTH